MELNQLCSITAVVNMLFFLQQFHSNFETFAKQVKTFDDFPLSAKTKKGECCIIREFDLCVRFMKQVLQFFTCTMLC